MRTFITYLGKIFFVIGLFIFLGAPDFLSLAELFKQLGIGIGFMFVGLIVSNLEVSNVKGW